MKAIAYIKKFLFFVIIVVNTTSQSFAETVTIASWNVHKVYDEDYALECIANFVRNEKIDILCLQEVYLDINKTTGKLFEKNNLIIQLISKLKSKTKKDWGYITSAEYAIREDIGDYHKCDKGLDNIIFFNKNKLIVKDNANQYLLTDFESMKQLYKSDKNNIQIVTFTDKSSRNKLNIINVHLPFNKRPISGSFYSNCFDRDFHSLYYVYHGQVMKRTIICGDFNMPISDFNSVNCRSNTGFKASDFHVNEETTLKRKEYDFSQSYDHFVYCSGFEFKIVKNPQRAASKQNNGQLRLGTSVTTEQKFDFEDYRKNISDHVPIIMAIDL